MSINYSKIISIYFFPYCANHLLKTRNKKTNESHLFFYPTINKSIITSAAKPGRPSRPDTADVTKLIGTCKSNEAPKAFKKNKNKAPIRILTNTCPTKRMGLRGAPIRSTSTINPPSIAIISFGSNQTSLLHTTCTIILCKCRRLRTSCPILFTRAY